MDRSEEIISMIRDLEIKLSEKDNVINGLKMELDMVKNTLANHQHTDSDGTQKLRMGVESASDSGSITYFGNGGIAQISSVSEQNVIAIASGKDKGLGVEGSPATTTNTVIQLINQPTNGFISSYTGKLYQNFRKSVTSGGNTLVDGDFSWITNELAGKYISIYHPTNGYVFTRTVASNTSNTITISGTWPSSVSGCAYLVYLPTYLGQVDFPFRRIYALEGTGGGIRFGFGLTEDGQNGLLYMDAAGDLYWRNKSNVSTKLN